MTEKISVIIPAYNASNSIKKCIDSILSQTYKSLEIIIINDGSKDNTLEIMQEYEKKDSRIRIINKGNSGVASTRNLGINTSTGNYLMFIDSDDYIENNYIEKMYTELLDNNCDVAISGMTCCKESGQIIKKVSYKNNSTDLKFENIITEIINKLTFCSACKTLIKKSIIIDNKILFNEKLKYCEDMLFSFTTLKKAKKIRYVNNVGYYYVYNENSATNKTNLEAIHKYCEDNMFALNYIKENTTCKEYIIANRLLSKVNIAIKKLINIENINYKKFKKEAIYIYDKYIKVKGIEDYIKISEINYESKINILLIKMLLKNKYYTYYQVLKIKKIIKN